MKPARQNLNPVALCFLLCQSAWAGDTPNVVIIYGDDRNQNL